ncbi:quinone oxidoreductase [Klebsiella michiganensis]|uniref:Quinone oxidoreductase n=1 Tax=Klebsiella michiganensis TaxID=1134687 RepID=A0A7H4LUH5_9ENTR|nr:quinone oxidoreductase [Klebsiella michiganensis]
MEKLAALGADETVNLSQDEADLRTQFAGLAAQQIDVVVDYLWGRSAELLLPALAKHSPGNAPVRFIQVGSLSAADISLNGAVLRSSPLQLMGSGIGSLSVPQLLAATGEMLQAAVAGGLTIATTPGRFARSPRRGRRTTARNAPSFSSIKKIASAQKLGLIS